MNKLGIPSKGVNFCFRCFEFHDHSVTVNEESETVEVKLVCLDCGHEHYVWDDKSTFFEYDEEFKDSEGVVLNV